MTNFKEERSRYGTYSTQWDYVQDRFGEKNLLPFTISDMDFTIPDGTKDVLQQAVSKGFFGYTRWNHPDYKESITTWFSKQFQTQFAEDWCIYSPSVIYSLSVFISLLSKKNEKIVTFTPCYDAFFQCIAQNQRKLISFSLSENQGQFEIDFVALEALLATELPTIFLLCNPHNPTGRVFTQQELRQLISLCNDYQIALISDEIHMDVRRPNQCHVPILKLRDQIKVPVVLLSSPSKTFNLPGLGGSYAVVPDAALRAAFLAILKGRDGVSSIPYLALLATMDCYNNQEKWVINLNQVIDRNFKLIQKKLVTELSLPFQIPEATYLAWINLGQQPFTMEVLQEQLVHSEKVAIMRGDTYGREGKNYLRLNLGAPESKISEGLDRLIRGIKALK